MEWNGGGILLTFIKKKKAPKTCVISHACTNSPKSTHKYTHPGGEGGGHRGRTVGVRGSSWPDTSALDGSQGVALATREGGAPN